MSSIHIFPHPHLNARFLHLPDISDKCKWHGHCFDIPIQTIAHIFGIVNTLLSTVELLCYTLLYTLLYFILEREKDNDKNVCDMSLKTFDDPDDDCELKAGKVATALMGTSAFETVLSLLLLRGVYHINVYFCYIWFVFTSLLVLIFPLYQCVFFVVTNWRNSISYSVITISILHSLIKLYGMCVIVQFAKWVRKQNPHSGPDEVQQESLPIKPQLTNKALSSTQEQKNSANTDPTTRVASTGQQATHYEINSEIQSITEKIPTAIQKDSSKQVEQVGSAGKNSKSSGKKKKGEKKHEITPKKS